MTVGHILMTVCVCVLSAALTLQTVLHEKERRELLDRLMARNLAELKADTEENKQRDSKMQRHREVIKRWRMGGGDD